MSQGSDAKTDAPAAAAPAAKVVCLSPNPFYKYLYRASARSLCPDDRRMITLAGSDTARAAADILFKRHILAAPVFDTNDQCLGAVDVLSMLQLQRKELEAKEYREPEKVWTHFKDRTCKEILADMENKNLVPFFGDNPVSMLVDLLATGVHRVAVFAQTKELITTCSQSDVIKFIANVMEKNYKTDAALAKAADTPATDLGLLRPVQTVLESTPLLVALHQLALKRRRAYAVVDKNGKMLADISTSNLQYVGETNFHTLGMSVGDWIRKYSASSLNPACTTASSTLRQIVDHLALRRLHRLWVVDADGKPTHIVSLTDIMRTLSSGESVSTRMASADSDLKDLWRQPPEVTTGFAI